MEQKPWPSEISSSKIQAFNDWDAKSILSNLSFLEQKIHQVQHIVGSIANQNGTNLSFMSNEDLTAIILDLISTAGSLLPSIKRSLFSSKDPSLCPLPPPPKKESAMEVLQLEKDEILAPHTHFCSICGKGFKRDANLRMHMRGHGDEYKTPAALAKPGKDSSPPAAVKRYSCPFSGCKRNRDHSNFQPLKTLLCVKNHYKRSHCEKNFSCSRCLSKKFSVLADLKTHEKHCGRDKWLCSCGTTFSRKDKLFGHVALFQGHAPALPFDDGSRLSDTARRDPASGIDPEHQCYLPFDDETSDDEFLKAALGLWANSSNSLCTSASFLADFD